MKKVRPRIVLVRHGLAAPKGLMLGQSDVPLLPEGREQIAKLALRLAGMRFCAAWCSPLLRARQSAAILLAANPANVTRATVLEGLREISLGLWEGQNSTWLQGMYPELWEQRGRDFFGVRPPEGESGADLAARVWPAFQDIVRHMATQSGKEVVGLVAAHRCVNQAILAQVAGQPLADMRSIEQPPGAASILEVNGRDIVLVEKLDPKSLFQ